MNTLRMVLSGLLLAVPLAAVADENYGLYAGVGIGQYNIEIEDVDDIGETFRFDSDDTSWKAFGGWRFNKWIALELDYVDLGHPEDVIDGDKVDLEIHGIAPYLVGTLPLGIFELYAKLGYYFYDVKATVDTALGQVSASQSDEDLAYAFGVGLVLFEHINARLEYEIIDLSDTEDSNAIWLTGAWRF